MRDKSTEPKASGATRRRPELVVSADFEEMESIMDHVYPVTEIYGSSTKSVDDAIRQAVSAAQKTIRNLEWFEVTEIRGHITADGSVGHFQVGVKLGFRLEQKAGEAG
jgi:dodecin